MSVFNQIMKELAKVPSEELSDLRKEIALLVALKRSSTLEEQKTISSNVAAYLATK